jgi:tetratricopeptide (TPR) repeat protein
MLAVYPSAVFFDGLIQKSSLDLFLVAAFILLLPGADGGERRGRWLATGLVLGCLTLTRENALALIVVALVRVLASEGGDGWRLKSARAALLAAGLGCALLPVGLRNLVVGGEFHLTTSQFGPNFYIGNGPRADGTYVPLQASRGNARFEAQDAQELAEQSVGRQMTPGEVSRYWTSLTLRRIFSEPWAWLRLMLRKTLLLVNRVELVDTEDQITCGDFSPVLRLLNPLLTFGLLLPLAGAGLIFTWPERGRLRTLHLYLLIYSASVVAFYVLARYRFPLVPVLTLFAAAGVTRARAILRDSPRLFAAATATAVVLAIAANWPLAKDREIGARATTENNIGAGLGESGAPVETILPYLARAATLDPNYAAAHRNLGIALRRSGRPREALGHLQRALALAPAADLHTLVGLTLIDLGRPAEAVEHYRLSVLLDPSDADNQRRLAALLGRLQGLD